MRGLIFAAAIAAASTLAFSAPALGAPKNWDCSKPGNANKAVCKAAAKDAKAPAAKPAPAAAPAKAAAALKAAPAAAKTPRGPRNWDCTKPGNKNKAVCKSAAGATAPIAATAPAPKPAAPRPRKATAALASVEDHNPSGAIAQCKDGTYSHAKARTGACARHGGVGKWM